VVLADAVQPLAHQGGEQPHLLVGERVAGTVEHGKGRARIVLEQAPDPGVADGGVLASSLDQRGVGVRRRLLGRRAQFPALEDPLQRGLVGKRRPGTTYSWKRLSVPGVWTTW
jgi:hypothetical protein